MDIIELTEKAVEIASKDEKIREKMKGKVCSIVMALKDGEETYLTFSLNNDELELLKEKSSNPDFIFEISKEDFTNLMTSKAYGMMCCASEEIRLFE